MTLLWSLALICGYCRFARAGWDSYIEATLSESLAASSEDPTPSDVQGEDVSNC